MAPSSFSAGITIAILVVVMTHSNSLEIQRTICEAKFYLLHVLERMIFTGEKDVLLYSDPREMLSGWVFVFKCVAVPRRLHLPDLSGVPRAERWRVAHRPSPACVVLRQRYTSQCAAYKWYWAE